MTSWLSPDLFAPKDANPWPLAPLVPQAYGLVMADPPWNFATYSEKGEEKSPQAKYQTMSLEQIAELPVADLADKDCLLWLWGTAPLLPQQIAIMGKWGFRYVTSGAWVKTTKHGKIAFGTGYVLRNAHEMFLIGARGEPKTSRSVRSVVMGPVREHSRKPDEAYAAAETLIQGVRRADLFSRQTRAGWEGWGNEATKFDGGEP